MTTRQQQISQAEARGRGLRGWNIRCNRCGSYGAEWLRDIRPDWGAYAACPDDAQKIRAEISRHQTTMGKLTTVKFEQEHGP